jgi:sulfhydrogenase subunit beta (sulfur reductase)
MTPLYVPEKHLRSMLAEMLAGRELFGSAADGNELHLAPVAPAEVSVPPCRPPEPLKSLFFRPREALGRYFAEDAAPERPPRAVIGVAACDLSALQVLDWVFLEGAAIDPYYQALRENTALISVDCTEPREECFCTFPGGRPYAEGEISFGGGVRLGPTLVDYAYMDLGNDLGNTHRISVAFAAGGILPTPRESR